MLLPPDPDRRPDPDCNPLNLISEIGCLSLLLLLLICASTIFIYPSLFEGGDPNRDARAKIKIFFNEQESNYRDSGKFIKRQNETLTNNQNLQSYYKKIAATKLDRIIATTRSENLTGNRRKFFLGFIDVVRAKKIQQPNLGNTNRNEIQWQYLDIKSFICESNERGVDIPGSTVLDLVSDRCPTGYTQVFNKNFRINVAKSNIDLILHEQKKRYNLNKKFTEDFLKTPGFITTDPEPYQYRVQSSGKQIIISAKPKSYKNSLDLTYLNIAIATDNKATRRQYIYQYCESEVPNISIPRYLDISKIGFSENRQNFKSCPTGYVPRI